MWAKKVWTRHFRAQAKRQLALLRKRADALATLIALHETTRTHAMRRTKGAWIRAELREALYLRDGRRCVYCGTSEEKLTGSARLTLDHKTPPSRYRGKYYPNHPTNLLTACTTCNTDKGTMTMPEYVKSIGKPKLNHKLRCHLRRDWEPYIDQVRLEKQLDRMFHKRLLAMVEQGRLIIPADGDIAPF